MASSQMRQTTLLRTPIVRLSYPSLFEARGVAGDPNSVPKFGCSLILDARSQADPKFQERFAAMNAAVNAEGKRRFGDRWGKQIKKTPFRKGDEDNYADKTGYGAGTVFMRPTSKKPIPCVTRSNTPITNQELLYPGCYVNALLAVFSYEQTVNKGVSFGLRGIQFVEDGERLDDSVDVTEVFEALDAPDEDEATPEGAFAALFS